MLERTEASRPDALVVEPVAEPAVSVIIVTYGTGEIVLETIAALVEHADRPLEVIVVDNPTADLARATRHLLREHTRGVVLVTPDTNLGFGGGNDAGIAYARAAVIALVNPDLVVTAGWLAPLVAALDDPEVAIAAPVLAYPDGRLQEAGQVIFDSGSTAAIGGPEIFTGDRSQLFARDVDYASAACWVLRRAEHLARGGFDDRFHPAFFEDADYGLTVDAAGQVTRLVPEVIVVHHHGCGGAGRETAADAARDVFVAKWVDRLSAQPPRPTDDIEAIANRDRPARRRIAYRIGDDARRSALFAEAHEVAATHPRDRVTVIARHTAGWDLSDAARIGLEVVIGDVDRIAAARAPYVTDWGDETSARRGGSR